MVTDPNLPLLENAAQKLKPFLEEIAFVGGITLGLLITDTGAAPIRGTKDVDIIAEITTISDYLIFSQRLRNADFTEDAGEKPILCRWHNSGLILDVLPLDKDVLGYTNIWYKALWKRAAGSSCLLARPSASSQHHFFSAPRWKPSGGVAIEISSPVMILRTLSP